jgi:phage-related protein
LKQLVLDDVPDSYFTARLQDAVDCERLILAAGAFDLKFVCPHPFAYALTDESFNLTATGANTVTRTNEYRGADFTPSAARFYTSHKEYRKSLSS